MMDPAFGGKLLAVTAAAAIVSAALIALLRPLLIRYALAQPNARSSHTTPTPQGGGIAVVISTLAATAAFAIGFRDAGPLQPVLPLLLGVVALAGLGAYDDIRPLGAMAKLLPQFAAVALVVATLPGDLRVSPMMPLAIERAAEIVVGIYVVNLVNFMDGIDLMTVIEVVPVTAAVAVLAAIGLAGPLDGALAAALLGATLGFAPFNRPVAKLFLGDVGSLPLGLLIFYLMTTLAGHGHVAPAIILPLYYLADATLTLLRRLIRGENIFEAHRTHVYQVARARGMSVEAIISRVFAVNMVLAMLALAAAWIGTAAAGLVAFLLAAALVTVLLVNLSRGAP